jgi:hypothetical protein
MSLSAFKRGIPPVSLSKARKDKFLLLVGNMLLVRAARNIHKYSGADRKRTCQDSMLIPKLWMRAIEPRISVEIGEFAFHGLIYEPSANPDQTNNQGKDVSDGRNQQTLF